MAADHVNLITGIVMLFTFWLIALGDIGCTSILNNDTCVIHRTSIWEPAIGSIICDESYPICIIQCESVMSCSDNIFGNRLSIVCASQTCIINCLASRSCRNTQITTNTSEYTEINIKANNAGRDMRIYTSKELHINVIGEYSDFLESIIYSNPNSTAININCDNGETCSDNTVLGANVSESLTFSCTGTNSDCSNTNVWCPASICSIHCAHCQNLNVHMQQSLSGFSLECANNNNSCIGSTVFCDMNETDIVWNADNSHWDFDQRICSEISFVSTTLSTRTPTTNTSQIMVDLQPNVSFQFEIGIRANEDFVTDSLMTVNPFYVIAIAMAVTICITTILFYGMGSCKIKQKTIAAEYNEQQNDNEALGEFVCKTEVRKPSVNINEEYMVIDEEKEVMEPIKKDSVSLDHRGGEMYSKLSSESTVVSVSNAHSNNLRVIPRKYKQIVNMRSSMDVDVDEIDETDLSVQYEGKHKQSISAKRVKKMDSHTFVDKPLIQTGNCGRVENIE